MVFKFYNFNYTFLANLLSSLDKNKVVEVKVPTTLISYYQLTY